MALVFSENVRSQELLLVHFGGLALQTIVQSSFQKPVAAPGRPPLRGRLKGVWKNASQREVALEITSPEDKPEISFDKAIKEMKDHFRRLKDDIVKYWIGPEGRPLRGLDGTSQGRLAIP